MKLSIVATLYQSESYIREYLERSSASAKQLVGEDFEIILVNDGSPDNSLSVAIELMETYSQLVVVDLSRNFGHHRAMMTGLSHAKGERVFLIDSDLEEEPEFLLNFNERMEKESRDVVFGVQAARKGGLFERFSGWLFYIIFNVLTGFDFPKNIVTARLMKRGYVDALLMHTERELSIGGLFYITGFNQVAQEISKGHRSQSTYTLGHKFSVFVNSVASFSSKPLVWIFFLGMIVLMISILISIYYTINALLLGEPVSGWTSLIISIWMLGGLMISCVGIVGIYVSKIYIETKQRPYTIVRRIYDNRTEQASTQNQGKQL